jgi:hypothetical protein
LWFLRQKVKTGKGWQKSVGSNFVRFGKMRNIYFEIKPPLKRRQYELSVSIDLFFSISPKTDPTLIAQCAALHCIGDGDENDPFAQKSA